MMDLNYNNGLDESELKSFIIKDSKTFTTVGIATSPVIKGYHILSYDITRKKNLSLVHRQCKKQQNFI